MRTMLVASTAPYTGKSGIALALLAILAEHGADVGYFKPYGTMPVTEDGVETDHDALYINRVLARPSEQRFVCPVVRSRAFVEGVLEGSISDRVPEVSHAFSVCSAGRDAMVVEGPTEPHQGRAVGISLHSLAGLLDAKVLLIHPPSGKDLPESVLAVADTLGDRLGGVLLNGVREEDLAFVTERVVPYLAARGLTVSGVVPHDPALSSVTVAELVDVLGGTVIAAADHLDRTLETFMVGAMGQDKALRFFRRKARKAVITGGDRADVQLAALETSTHCIILTGNHPPSPVVLARAEELGVPIVLVDTDTLTAVERLDALMGRVRIHDSAKAVRIRAMFEDAVDWDSFRRSLGID